MPERRLALRNLLRQCSPSQDGDRARRNIGSCRDRHFAFSLFGASCIGDPATDLMRLSPAAGGSSSGEEVLIAFMPAREIEPAVHMTARMIGSIQGIEP